MLEQRNTGSPRRISSVFTESSKPAVYYYDWESDNPVLSNDQLINVNERVALLSEAAELLMVDLQLESAPEVRIVFNPAEPGDISAFGSILVRKNIITVNLAATLLLPEATREYYLSLGFDIDKFIDLTTLAHEFKHKQQYETGSSQDEREATLYAVPFAVNYLMSNNHDSVDYHEAILSSILTRLA